MSTTAPKPATTPIPVQLSEPEFDEFLLPHLSMPKRGPKCKLGYHRVFNLILWVLYTGMQWKCLPVPKDARGHAAIHYTTVYKVFARWSDDGSLEDAFIASVKHLADQHQLDLRVLHGDGTNTVAKKGGDGIGYSGYKHQKGEQVIAIIDNNGSVLAPLPVAPVNEAETVLLPEGLKRLKRVAKRTGLVLQGAYLNLDGGFDAKAHRQAIFNAGMIPNEVGETFLQGDRGSCGDLGRHGGGESVRWHARERCCADVLYQGIECREAEFMGKAADKGIPGGACVTLR